MQQNINKQIHISLKRCGGLPPNTNQVWGSVYLFLQFFFSAPEEKIPANILKLVTPVDYKTDFKHLQGIFIPLKTDSCNSLSPVGFAPYLIAMWLGAY